MASGFRTSPIGLRIGAGLVGLLLATALVSLFWTPYDPAMIVIAEKLKPISVAHWLGTDHFGRDTLSMVMRGGVISIVVACAAVALGAGIGVPLGLIAAARDGWLRRLILNGSDFLFAFPALLTAILLQATLGPGMMNAVLAIGIFNIPVFARVTHGAALPIWTKDFIMASRIAGRRDVAISWRHVLPNIGSLLIVQLTVQMSLALIAEAALSYIGLGVQPPLPSWGRMLSEAQTFIAVAPRLALVPGLAILLFVLGLSLLGSAMSGRDNLTGERRGFDAAFSR
ncbi:MAG: ABC transporter permease [Hyphomicrobiales bacterium]